MADFEGTLRDMIARRERMIEGTHEIISRQAKEYVDLPIVLQEKNRPFIERIDRWQTEAFLLMAVFEHAGVRYDG